MSSYLDIQDAKPLNMLISKATYSFGTDKIKETDWFSLFLDETN